MNDGIPWWEHWLNIDFSIPTKQPYSGGNQKIHHGDENRKKKRKHGKH